MSEQTAISWCDSTVRPARFGPKPAAPRDGDKVQARQRVNVEVRTGRRAHPNTLQCVDCGHVHRPGERRHEYDHHLGYAAEHHGHVEPVCTVCHRSRCMARGEINVSKLKLAAAARSAGRKTVCAKGHAMGRGSDGHWRCQECRREYWRGRDRG